MSRNNVWLIALGAALVGVLVGGGGVWATQNGKTAGLSARLTAANAARDRALSDAALALEQVKKLETTTTVSIIPTPTASENAPTTPTTPTKKAVTLKEFAFVKKVSTSGTRPVLTADYALMLTGTAATKAAKAHGDESPPPNDYYIVNDNKLLRKLPVKSGISVTVTTNADGTSDATGHKIPFATWAGYYATPNADNASLRESPYWLTIKNSVVTAISEPYLP